MKPQISEAVVFVNGPWANQSRPLDKSYKPGFMLKVIYPVPGPVPVLTSRGMRSLPLVDSGFRVGHYEMVWHGTRFYVQRYGVWRGATN